MKVGTIVKYNGDHIGVFLYPHDKVLVADSQCSIMNRLTKKITHVNFENIKLFKNICWSCGHEVLSDESVKCPVCNWVLCPQCKSCKKAKCNEDGIYIFDLESWHDYNNCSEPEGDNNYWVKLDNHELVYKGEILDIDFEIYIEKLVSIGLEPVLVIDYKNWQVFIYAKTCDANESREIINTNIADHDDYDYYDMDIFDITNRDYGKPRVIGLSDTES